MVRVGSGTTSTCRSTTTPLISAIPSAVGNGWRFELRKYPDGFRNNIFDTAFHSPFTTARGHDPSGTIQTTMRYSHPGAKGPVGGWGAYYAERESPLHDAGAAKFFRLQTPSPLVVAKE